MKLSIIIPSYRDPLLAKTINSLLDNSEIEMEIIVILDGYVPDFEINNDSRVKLLYLGKNRGMRDAINAGVSISKGEYIMRADEHQLFGKGFDRIILENIEDNWIVTPRRYFLDPLKWEIMDIPPIDSCKLFIDNEYPKFSSIPIKNVSKEMIIESYAMQGSCWLMKRTWWDKVIVELQSEGYGTHYQDSVEMIFKTWQNGGKLMVNKNTYHAHKHRDFSRTHNINREDAQKSFDYSLKIWKPYYEEVIKTK